MVNKLIEVNQPNKMSCFHKVETKAIKVLRVVLEQIRELVVVEATLQVVEEKVMKAR